MSIIELLDKLTDSIRTRHLLSIPDTDSLYYEEIIRERDSPEFERHWLDKFRTLEMRTSEIRNNELEAIDELREVAYKTVFARTNSPDLAAFVSDDFELIARAAVLAVNDPWINGLWLNYKNGGIHPKGIVPVDGVLLQMISHGL